MMRWAEHRDISSIVRLLEIVDEQFFPPLSKRKSGITHRVMGVMEDENSGYLLYEDGGTPVAVGGYTLGKNGREGAYINMLCVLPKLQARGIGGRVLHELERRLFSMGVGSVWVCTWSTNTRALNLYLKNGYSIERCIEHHRAKDVHTLVLSKHLGGDDCG
ncbi:MAG: GNAT family N-acetyltransferase [Methermicoccaceae archaeon]